MKKRLIGLGVATLIFGGFVSANATLTEMGSGVLFDDVADQYWIQDLHMFVNQTYGEQISNIANLNTDASWVNAAWDSWKMATENDMSALLAYDIASISTFFGQSSDDYWDGRLNTPGSSINTHLQFSMWDTTNDGVADMVSPLGGWDKTDAEFYGGLGAWVVANAASPVPEPATMLLFGTGLVGLVGTRMRKKKK